MKENAVIPRRGNSTKRERHQFWEEMINNYLAGKLSRQEFCQRNGLLADEFKRWHYRLKNKLRLEKHTDKAHPANPGSRFVAVTIKPTPQDSSATSLCHPIYLELPNQLRIQLSNDFNPRVLHELLKILGVSLC